MHAMHEAMILMPQVAPPGPGELRIRIMAVAPSPLDVAGQKVPRESDAAGRNEMLGNHLIFPVFGSWESFFCKTELWVLMLVPFYSPPFSDRGTFEGTPDI